MSEARNAMHLDYEARVEAHRKATGVDLGVHSHAPHTEQALAARIDQEADVVSPKWDAKLEVPGGAFYSTDGRWGPTHESLSETPEERTVRLSGVPPLGTPPGYGNRHPLDALRDGMGPHMTEMNGALPVLPMQEVIARAVHNSPPPLDDVGGVEDELFDPEDPNHPAFAHDIPEFDPDFDLAEPDPFDPANLEITGAGGICMKAAGIVTGARAAQHGPKERNHKNIAILWRAFVDLRAANGHSTINAWDVATMMELLKIARRFAGSGRKNVDNYVDGAGYAAIAGEIALNEEEL